MKPKLIRDKIPSVLDAKRISYQTHNASDTEFASFLDEKLLEEANEFISSKNPEELADILEVIHALAANQNSSMDEIEKLRIQKKQERGGFLQRIILDKLE